MGRPHVQVDFSEALLARYESGELNHHDVARIFRISPNTALQELRRAGADTSRSTRKRLQFARRLGVPNLPETLAHLYERGLSLPQVAQEVGMTAEGVRKILIRHGVAVRPRGPKGVIWASKSDQGRRAVLAQRLRSLRLKAGFSQSDLARKSGLSQHTISGLETCRHAPSDQTMDKLARALHVERGELENSKGTPINS
jgi:DNA-binding XRE family transcriptional regulator